MTEIIGRKWKKSNNESSGNGLTLCEWKYKAWIFVTVKEQYFFVQNQNIN